MLLHGARDKTYTHVHWFRVTRSSLTVSVPKNADNHLLYLLLQKTEMAGRASVCQTGDVTRREKGTFLETESLTYVGTSGAHSASSFGCGGEGEGEAETRKDGRVGSGGRGMRRFLLFS